MIYGFELATISVFLLSYVGRGWIKMVFYTDELLKVLLICSIWRPMSSIWSHYFQLLWDVKNICFVG